MFYREHKRVYQPSGGELVTKQEFKAECDVYNVLKQFQRTGVINHIARGSPRFEDLPSEVDLQDAMHMIQAAEEAFSALPARLRAKYQNDPGLFLRALEDPSNREEFVELGILKPPRPADPAGEAAPPTGAA